MVDPSLHALHMTVGFCRCSTAGIVVCLKLCYILDIQSMHRCSIRRRREHGRHIKQEEEDSAEKAGLPYPSPWACEQFPC